VIAHDADWWVIAIVIFMSVAIMNGIMESVSRVCASCGSPDIVPPESPRGLKERDAMKQWHSLCCEDGLARGTLADPGREKYGR
jgi:hypothetical protein